MNPYTPKLGDVVSWHIRGDLESGPSMTGIVDSVYPQGKTPYIGEHNAFCMVRSGMHQEMIRGRISSVPTRYAVNLNNPTLSPVEPEETDQ